MPMVSTSKPDAILPVVFRDVTPSTSAVGKISPWLRATHQVLWPRSISMAEKTVCLGWLLYSAPEYNREAISQAIYKVTGVPVAL